MTQGYDIMEDLIYKIKHKITESKSQTMYNT